METQKIVLTSSVFYLEGKGKAQTVTAAVIRLSNGQLVAGAKLGGRFSAEQALQEFVKFPLRFKHYEGYPLAIAAGYTQG